MKNVSSWLIMIFVIMFWILRVVVAITGTTGADFAIKPINDQMEIILVFVVLILIPFLWTRKIIAAIAYLGIYGWYFGPELLRTFPAIMGGEVLNMDMFMNLLMAVIGVALPIAMIIDILLCKTREKNPIHKDTDWFYKNEQYDRKLDERADKNNYRTM